ncbi:MAG: DNRLRE domain-containing protein [Chloroflexi bacterium]|nr:DNRLRE domain-containing protein [Chloroflexota bacterium]
MAIITKTINAFCLATLIMIGVATPGINAPRLSTKDHIKPQETVVLTAVADATVKSWQSGSNFGGASSLDLSYSSIDTVLQTVSLFRFDLSSQVPSDAIIDSATLKLYLDSSEGAGTVDIGSYFVTSSWSEYGVTWNSFPTADPLGLNASVGSGVGYKTWNITSYAQSWLAGANNGVYLRGPTDGTYFGRHFRSREGGGNPPQLEITYHIPCSNDPYEPNDSFGQATSTTSGGVYQAYICGSGDEDFYRIWVNSGQQIGIDMDGSGGGTLPADFDIELWDPDEGYVTQSNNSGGALEHISYTANQSGYWMIRVMGYLSACDADDVSSQSSGALAE